VDTEHLVTMANDIATFFESDGGADEAVAKIQNHLKLFWEPRMRTAIIRHLAAGGEGLSALARAAVAQLKMPASAA
jgi:formate dehydrogenase subunit delta